MSRNHREPVKPVESESEESGEDEDASSEEESDSEPEPTQKNAAKPQQTPAAKPQQTPTPTPQPPPSSSSEEEESGETESESDEQESKLNPPPSKPVEKSSNAKNSRSKPNASVPATPIASKRSATEDVSTPKGSKKMKANDGETPEKKSVSFQRVFTEDDEIVILQGMNDYRSEKKSDPVTDMDGFYEYIKEKLQADLSSKIQLQTKVKRLKKKFVSNNDKEKEGKLRLLANSREQKLYGLSKLFWENQNENGVEGSSKAKSVAKKTPNKKVNGTVTASEGVKNVKNSVVVGVENMKNVAFAGEPKKLKSDDGASMEETMLKTGRELYEAGEGIEGEDEWRKLRVEELELYIKQLEVRAAQAKLVLDVMKPRDH